MYRHQRESSAGGCLIAFGMFFALPGLGFMLYSLTSGNDLLFGILFGGIFSLVGLLVVFAGIHSMMGDSLFQDLALETPEPRTRLGEKLPFRVSWKSKRSFRVDSLKVSYYLEEKAILRRGTNSTTYSRKVFEQERSYDLARDFQPRESFEISGEFQIPDDGPSTFEGNNNSLIWKLEVTMDVPNWPDPSATWNIPMRPVLAPVEEEEGDEQEAEIA